MTSIEWTEKTWNPVRGCSRVSPGCDNCYAMRLARRMDHPAVADPSTDRSLDKPAGAYFGLTAYRRGKVDWSGKVRLVPEMLDDPLRARQPSVWFVNSMSDMFHEGLHDPEIAAIYAVMAASPHHVYQILTKRRDRMKHFYEWFAAKTQGDPVLARALLYSTARLYGIEHRLLGGLDQQNKRTFEWPLPNVWIGMSTENQQYFDERIGFVHEIPAAVRFLSIEPMLGRIKLNATARLHLDWVIAGGESGYGCRHLIVDWLEDLVEQCRANDLPLFVKQLGTRPWLRAQDPRYDDPAAVGIVQLRLKHPKGGDIDEWPKHLRIRQFPARAPTHLGNRTLD